MQSLGERTVLNVMHEKAKERGRRSKSPSPHIKTTRLIKAITSAVLGRMHSGKSADSRVS